MQMKKLFYVQFCGKSYIFHQNAARPVPRGILFWYKNLWYRLRIKLNAIVYMS